MVNKHNILNLFLIMDVLFFLYSAPPKYCKSKLCLKSQTLMQKVDNTIRAGLNGGVTLG